MKKLIKVKVIDLHSLAVINVFESISSKELKKDSSYIVMDIGAQKTSLIIFRNHRIIFVKNGSWWFDGYRRDSKINGYWFKAEDKDKY